MKKTLKHIFSLAAAVMLLAAMMLPAFAASKVSIEDMQKSIVYIEHEFTLTSRSYNNLSFTLTGSGTGFAIGIPGKPVQYIGSANHVTDPQFNNGIYQVTLDSSGRVISYKQVNAKYPQHGEDNNGNLVVIDYFTGTTESLFAYYSVSTQDKVSLKVVDHSYAKDVSVCKIGSEPTEKIVARPLRTRETVETGENIVVVGYPGITRNVDSEHRFDYSDSSVTKGSIQKTAELMSSDLDETVSVYLYTVDASVTQGNSGGPLFDEQGNILGICSFSSLNVEKLAQANYFPAIDELINLLNAAKIPYAVAGEGNLTLIIIIVAVVLVVIIAALIVLLAMRNKKQQQPAPAASSSLNETFAANFNPVSVPTGTVGETLPEKETSKKMYLLGIKGYFEGKKFAITDRVVIGRDSSRCNVVFPPEQPGVSSVHCAISISGGSLSIKDCGSTYGTYLADGNKLPANLPTVLRSGAQFWVGDKQNVFEVRY